RRGKSNNNSGITAGRNVCGATRSQNRAKLVAISPLLRCKVLMGFLAGGQARPLCGAHWEVRCLCAPRTGYTGRNAVRPAERDEASCDEVEAAAPSRLRGCSIWNSVRTVASLVRRKVIMLTRALVHVRLLIIGFAMLSLAPVTSLAETGPRATQFTLPNGLMLVVIPDHRAPVVTHLIWHRAGAADESPGPS